MTNHFWKGKKQPKEMVAKRVASRCGYKHSLETIEKIRSSNMGRVCSPETCLKISINRKGKGIGRILSEETKEKIRSKHIGKKLTLEHRNKLSVSHIGQKCWNKGKHGIYSEETLNKIRNARLHQVFPIEDTLPERMMQEELLRRNIVFETHKAILGQPDIFIAPNICIFVDGCYWHGCMRCFHQNDQSAKQRKQQVYDMIITQKLIDDGYKVLRYWEHEIEMDAAVLGAEIEKELIVMSSISSKGVIE